MLDYEGLGELLEDIHERLGKCDREHLLPLADALDMDEPPVKPDTVARAALLAVRLAVESDVSVFALVQRMDKVLKEEVEPKREEGRDAANTRTA